MLALRRLSSLCISPEVKQALQDKVPLVALESTIITHGFPYPANLSMAREVEQTIRDNACVPATCAFIDGKPHVGLSSQQLESMAGLANANKVSRRDIGATMAQKLNGGTTIAGTMILAHMAGIKVFATGGLGGVHRDGHISMDVSADLTELSRTPVTVVCAGPKSILDIPRTMEFLETQGVFVGTYNDNGRSNVEVPGFFCRDSGVPSPYTFSSWKEMAAIVHNSNNVMGLTSGNLVCVPPPEQSSLSSELMAQIINDANSEASEKGISGKHLTPFLLKKIAVATDGKSVECNKKFVINNAKAACNIAKELYSLEEEADSKKSVDLEYGFQPSQLSQTTPPSSTSNNLSEASFQASTGIRRIKESNNNVSDSKTPAFTEEPIVTKVKSNKYTDRADTLVIGSVALDTICRFEKKPVMADSNPGSIVSSIGGVGFNVSLAHQYGLINQETHSKVRFVSIVGNDLPGMKVMETMKSLDLDTSGLKVLEQGSTAQYNASLNEQGSLVLACADMKIVESDVLIEHSVHQIERAKPRFIVIDCNVSPRCIEKVISAASQMDMKPRVIIEPTSKPKSARISQINSSLLSVFPQNNISLITPTSEELHQIYSAFSQRDLFDDYDSWFPLLDGLGIDANFREKVAMSKEPGIQVIAKEGILQQAFQILPYIPNILIKLGDKGCVLVMLSTSVDDYRSIPTSSAHRPTTTLVSHGRQLDADKRLGVVVEYYDVPAENANLPIVNVTGAGDCLLGYLSSTLTTVDWLGDEVESLEHEWGRWKAIHKSQLASGASLTSHDSVSSKISEL